MKKALFTLGLCALTLIMYGQSGKYEIIERALNNYKQSFPKIGVPIAEFMKHPYASKLNDDYIKHLVYEGSDEMQYLLSSDYPFSNNKVKERSVSRVVVDGLGVVLSYNIDVEVESTEIEMAMREVLGVPEIEVKNLNSDKFRFGYVLTDEKIRLYFRRFFKTTKKQFVRNGKETTLQYVEISISKMDKNSLNN